VAQPIPGLGAFSANTTLSGEFDLDPALAMAWVDEVIRQPPAGLSPSGIVALLLWRGGLGDVAPVRKSTAQPGITHKAKWLLTAACREATSRNPEWAAGSTQKAGAAANLAMQPKTPWDQLPDEIWSAVFGTTNLPGTIANGWLLLESLARSLPLEWRVKLQKGHFELYDANSSHRSHAFGKAGKLRYPPKMKLRVVGAKLSWLPDGARVSGGMARIPVPRARSLGEALKILRASVMKLIPQTALNQLPLAGKLGGPITGMALTLGPQAIADAKRLDFGPIRQAAATGNSLVMPPRNRSPQIS
jgi:hypothetical protein